MKKAPKSLRLHIAIFGRTNVGKSSFLNLATGQDVAITSPVPGTTTDVVEKAMELLPLGPVLFLDTAGLDDTSELSKKRLEKSRRIFDRSDIILLVVEPEIWTDYETNVVREAETRDIPLIVIINKTDLTTPGGPYLSRLRRLTERIVLCSSLNTADRDVTLSTLKKHLIEVCPADFLQPPPLIGDLVPASGLAVLIVPIDLQAPKGRLILPQVQTIRDTLDNDAASLIVKEREYAAMLDSLKTKPDIVVCDSQVVLKMTADTPADVKCTTFSTLFSRYKGDLIESVKGATTIDKLKDRDKVLIAEACTHHPLEDDIGRVKIPRWLKQYTGADLDIDMCAGKDYPDNLKSYKLIIHCGGCTLNRRHMLARIQYAKEQGVPITNYGVSISFLQGVLKRILSPFPAALDALQRHSTSASAKHAR